jgi:hypothetical protein
MQTENEQEAKLLTDFRLMREKDQAFISAYAAVSAANNANTIPAPSILTEATGLTGRIFFS